MGQAPKERKGGQYCAVPSAHEAILDTDTGVPGVLRVMHLKSWTAQLSRGFFRSYNPQRPGSPVWECRYCRRRARRHPPLRSQCGE
jgi:hypothetical protein